MKKVAIFISIALLFILCLTESRMFINVGNEKYLTVWKSYSKCYIIPGKYYGLWKPSVAGIELGRKDIITLFFSDSIPEIIFYQSEKPIKLINNNKGDIFFKNYYDNPLINDSILYKKGALKNSDVKDHVHIIDVILEDNYIIDKYGRRLD